MRLIHTSDWHLGQTLHGQDRDHEHARFLDWLLRQLEEQRADVLLIAGDIFDTINPPLKAQERLYDFIVSAHRRLPQLEIVMIAGNHDSGARIELPAPLMKRLNAHAIGRIGWIDESLDSDRLLLPCTTRMARSPPGAWPCPSCVPPKSPEAGSATITWPVSARCTNAWLPPRKPVASRDRHWSPSATHTWPAARFPKTPSET